MPHEIKWELYGQKDGSLRAMVTGVDKRPNQLLRNQREYMNKFMADLDAREYNRLDVIVNCTGGYVISAMGMMMALEFRAKKAPVRILIDSQCSSAATLLLGTSFPAYIVPTGRIMIHKSKREVYQGKGEKWSLLKMLSGTETTNSLLIRSLRVRAKHNKKPLLKGRVKVWMEQGHVFTAEEAVEHGIVDGIMTRTEFDKGNV